jgi:hypothetical protein
MRATKKAGRYVVGPIAPRWARMFRDCGIHVGDVVDAPEGFPRRLDDPQPPAPVTLTRELHPNVALVLREAVDTLHPLEPRGDHAS